MFKVYLAIISLFNRLATYTTPVLGWMAKCCWLEELPASQYIITGLSPSVATAVWTTVPIEAFSGSETEKDDGEKLGCCTGPSGETTFTVTVAVLSKGVLPESTALTVSTWFDPLGLAVKYTFPLLETANVLLED